MKHSLDILSEAKVYVAYEYIFNLKKILNQTTKPTY